MKHYQWAALLGCTCLSQIGVPAVCSQQSADPKQLLLSDARSSDASLLPPSPRGKSTVLGGAIRDIDPVRDQLSLVSFGERPLKILFDERTQVFRDGVRMPLHELSPVEHASVQTVLDGSSIFAISIHVLSQAPQGEFRGHVLTFNTSTGELFLASSLSPAPIHLLVPADTLITPVGQLASNAARPGRSDLSAGCLVSVSFEPRRQGPPVAKSIQILAAPGFDFIFAGTLEFLDVDAGSLAVVDPRDQQHYQISFDSAHIPASRNLHVGDRVRVTANYQAPRYVATELAPY